MKSNPRKRTLRTRLLIYPRFQLTLLAINLIIMSVTFLIMSFVISKSYSQLKAEGLAANLSADHAYFKFVEYQSDVVFSYLGAALIIGFVFSSLLTLIISNKLAGPVIRLHEYFRQIIQGQRPIPAVFFRKGDFFRELPPLINRAVESIQADKGKDKKKDEAA